MSSDGIERQYNQMASQEAAINKVAEEHFRIALRSGFAGQAMNGLLSSGQFKFEEIVEQAMIIADKMVEAVYNERTANRAKG